MPRKSSGKPFYTIDCETDPFESAEEAIARRKCRICEAGIGQECDADLDDRIKLHPERRREVKSFIWGLYDGQIENYYKFATAHELIDFVKDSDVIIYAHNGGRFDYHYLRDFINSDDILMVISGRMARFKVGAAEFRDSINILVNPLRAFAKEEIDYAKLEADVRHLHRDEIERYLRSDCVNLWNTIKRYFDKYGRALTQAGSSMKYWKKHYKTPMIAQTVAQSAAYRDYYYGGRVQCFAEGVKDTHFSVIDINSAYPYAMKFKHPISPYGDVSDVLPPEGQIEKCFVRLNAIARGCFPWRDETGALYFPDDGKVREYFITGWELVAAFELDAVQVINIIEVHQFALTVDFDAYVMHFYKEREEAKKIGDKAASTFAKLFMNSLYGKFAADPEKYNEYVIASDDTVIKWKKDGYERAHPWGDRHLMTRALPEEKHRYYNVCTAASITGFVRAHLFKAISRCTGVYYCDTDSIAARDISSVNQGDKLGEWKLELECDRYAIAGKKLYAFRAAGNLTTKQKEELDEGEEGFYKTACKGVNLTADKIIRVARGETIIHNPLVPTYSIHTDTPRFTPREVRKTAKDIRIAN